MFTKVSIESCFTLKSDIMKNPYKQWFFVASYVVTDNNKLTERDVDNDIPH